MSTTPPSTYFLKADDEAYEIFKRVANGFPRFNHIDTSQVEIIYKVAAKNRFAAEIRRIAKQYQIFLPGKELLITIFRPAWEGYNQPKKIAIMYHELLHVKFDDKKEQYTIIRHDVEDFREMITRVGIDYEKSLDIAKELEKNEEQGKQIAHATT